MTLWTAAFQASPSITNSWSLLKLIPITSVMPSSVVPFSSLLQSFPASGRPPGERSLRPGLHLSFCLSQDKSGVAGGKEPPARPTVPRAPSGTLTLPPKGRQPRAGAWPRPASLGSVHPLHTTTEMSWSQWDRCSGAAPWGRPEAPITAQGLHSRPASCPSRATRSPSAEGGTGGWRV